MAVKSVIEVDVDDKAFKNFQALYQKYQTQLKGMPKVWGEVSKQIDGTKKTFQGLIAGLIVERFHQQAILKAQKEVDKLTRTTAENWANIGRHSSGFLGTLKNIGHTATRLAKDLGIFGLIGAGGIYGIDRLAAGVGAQRKASQALGLTYGQGRAFSLNYERLLPGGAEAFLGAVSGARGTAEGKAALYGAGLNQGDLQGNTADVASKLITRLKPLFDRTNENLLGNVIQARRLDQLGIDVDFARIIRSTKSSELGGIAAGYRQDIGALGLDPGLQKRFQDFAIQLSRAGQRIETAFIKGIDPLIPQLNKLSDAFEKVVVKLLGDKAFGHLIDVITAGLEKFAGYVGTPKFAQDIDTLVEGIDKAAKGIGRFAGFVGSLFGGGEQEGVTNVGSIAGIPVGIREGSFADRLRRSFTGQVPLNNPGNLRVPGSSTDFAQFSSEEAGLKAVARQLRIYQGRDHLDTISGIIGKYAPASENDVASYVKDVSARTGFSANQKLNLSDNATMAKLVSAITRHETGKGTYSPEIVVRVLNETGANVTVTGNQVARGQ
jgi:hypothetical protein